MGVLVSEHGTRCSLFGIVVDVAAVAVVVVVVATFASWLEIMCIYIYISGDQWWSGGYVLAHGHVNQWTISVGIGVGLANGNDR